MMCRTILFKFIILLNWLDAKLLNVISLAWSSCSGISTPSGIKSACKFYSSYTLSPKIYATAGVPYYSLCPSKISSSIKGGP